MTITARGAAVHSLLANPTWLRRRVEAISFLSAAVVERRVTLDIDNAAVRGAYGLGSTQSGLSNGTLWVPLTTMRKGIILDLDVRTDAGCAMATCTREENADTAAAVAMERLRQVSMTDPDREAIRAHVRQIAYGFPEPAPPADGFMRAWRAPKVWTTELATLWDQVVQQQEAFRSLLFDITYHFLLMTPVRLSDDAVTLLKYSFREQVRRDSPTLRERLVLRSAIAMVELPAAEQSRSYHLKVDAPSGLIITDADLVHIGERVPPAGPLRPEPAEPAEDSMEGAGTYYGRTTLPRAHVYAIGMHDDAGAGSHPMHALKLELRVPVDGFLRAARLTTLLSSLVLLVGMVLADKVAKAQSDAAVGLLLAAPSVLSAYLVRPDEHAMLSNALRFMRYLVSATVLFALVAAGSVFLGAEVDVVRYIWLSLGVATLAASAALWNVSLASDEAAKRVISRANETHEHHAHDHDETTASHNAVRP